MSSKIKQDKNALQKKKKDLADKQHVTFGESCLKFSFIGFGIVLYLLSNLYHH